MSCKESNTCLIFLLEKNINLLSNNSKSHKSVEIEAASFSTLFILTRNFAFLKINKGT